MDFRISSLPSLNFRRILVRIPIMGKNLEQQGFTDIYPKEKERFYVKVPAFSFSKLRGMDAYLSPEMKSTGELPSLNFRRILVRIPCFFR